MKNNFIGDRSQTLTAKDKADIRLQLIRIKGTADSEGNYTLGEVMAGQASVSQFCAPLDDLFNWITKDNDD